MKNEQGIYAHVGKLPLWDNGLPLGNGKIGCLIYGEGELRISVDRIDLWDNRTPPEALEKNFCFSELVRASKEDWAEHQRLFDGCYSHPYPTKLTAGRLSFSNFVDEKTEFVLDMREAKACVQSGKSKIELFMDALSFIGVARVTKDLQFELQAPMYLTKPESERGLGYPKGQYVTDGGFTYTVQKTTDEFCYGILVYRKSLQKTDELYFTVWSGTSEQAIAAAKEDLLVQSEKGFDALFAAHKNYWDNYYAISSLSTGDSAFDDYYFTAQYLFASTSRKGHLPMALQGVWTADNDLLPPWKGDYHADVNLQMSYEHFMKAGRFDEGRVLCDYLWEKREAFRAYAKEFHGVDGILIPGVFTMEGKPLGGWPMYAMNPASGAWLTKCFSEYYAYTGDEKFFAERAYPFLREYVDATEKLLVDDGKGLRYPFSASPEYFEDDPKAYLPSQSNFELAILKGLYTTVEGYARKAGDIARAERYASILSRFKEFSYNEDGSLRICAEQDYEKSHRHFSHQLAICPYHLFDAEKDREMILSNVKQLEKYGSHAWVGFSFVVMAELCAYIGEGNRAYRYLRGYLEAYVAENGFHLNGDYKHYGYGYMDYRPFTLEAVFEYCKALQNMLLACENGVIIPFPAIPDKWRENKLSFTELCVYGGVKVSASYQGGKVTSLQVKMPKGATICLKNVFDRENVVFCSGEKRIEVVCASGENFTVNLTAGVWSLQAEEEQKV